MKSRCHLRRSIFAASLAAAAITCALAAAEPVDAPSAVDAPALADAAANRSGPSDQDVARWITELDSNHYLVREQATQQLLSAGTAALDPLLAAANSDRPEPADRAVWVLKQLGESDDYALAAAALDRLANVERRPAVVQDAKEARDHLLELMCQRKLAALGGRLTLHDEMTPEFGQIQFVHVELKDDWHGSPDDLLCLFQLGHPKYFRFEGRAVGDAELKLFETTDDVALLQLFQTQVTPEAVDAIKERHPKTVVYVRNQALLGIGGSPHGQGVTVSVVQPGSGAAAAGIAVNDVITSLDGKPVKDFDRLTAQIAQHRPGEQIDVEILRGKEKLTKRVTLGRWGPP